MIMNKITVKEFVEGYNKCVDSLKNRYIQEKLSIISYLPVNIKDAIAIVITDRTMFEQEKYTDENGETKFRKTDNIHVNSFVQYMLFVREVIEKYTNLIHSDEANFMTDYDLLKSSGLLDKLMIGEIVNGKEIPPLIPISEISEIRTLIDMHKSDIMQNMYEPHAYVSRQVERFGTLINTLVEPFMESVQKKIADIPQEDVQKVIDFAKAGDFKEVE